MRRYPGDPEAWYVLGETRMHAPFPIGTPPATTFETFSRSIALDSGFAPAYEHMAELAIRLGRPELARRFAAAYLSLYPYAGTTSHVRLALLALDPTQSGAADTARLVDSASVNDILRAAIDSRLLHRLRGNPGPAAPQNGRPTPERGRRRGLGARFADVATVSGRRTRLPGPPPRGLPDRPPPAARPGRFEMEPVRGPIPRSGPAWGSPGLHGRARLRARSRTDRAVGLWFGFTPRHLRGFPWWLAHRDTASLTRFAARAAEEARRPNPPLVVLRARLLGATSTAYAALARGDSAGALGHLEAIPDTLCLGGDCFHLNLTLARLLAARGDDRRAGALLERWRWGRRRRPVVCSGDAGARSRGRAAGRAGEGDRELPLRDGGMAPAGSGAAALCQRGAGGAREARPDGMSARSGRFLAGLIARG